MESHLLQMRGLKQAYSEGKPLDTVVASFTDAWIETFQIFGCTSPLSSHLLQMRGLKPL